MMLLASVVELHSFESKQAIFIPVLQISNQRHRGRSMFLPKATQLALEPDFTYKRHTCGEVHLWTAKESHSATNLGQVLEEGATAKGETWLGLLGDPPRPPALPAAVLDSP